MKIKVGDIFQDNNNTIYRFTKVHRIVEDKYGTQVWGYWATTLNDLLEGIYINPDHLMYTTSNGIVIVEKSNTDKKNKYKFLFENA